MFERKSGILLLAGLGFFTLAFVSNGLLPALMYAHLPEQTVEEMIEAQVKHRPWTIMTQLRDLAVKYPEPFKKYYGEPTAANCAKALRLGRTVYIGEGCWHCHSQFVRPVSNEERRWGPVSQSKEYQNELQRPVLFGTRRVGPDLTREGGRRGNDWHAIHFFNPRTVIAQSVMPRYPWFFDGDAGQPNERGFAIILYMQFLGSWADSYPYHDGRDLSKPVGGYQ